MAQTTTGERLAAALKMSGISASQLAREIDVSRAAVSMWIHDKANMTGENAIQIARALDVSVRWLLDGEMKTPAGEWLELTPLEFEVIKVLRRFEAEQSQTEKAPEPEQSQAQSQVQSQPQKAVLKQYLNVDGTISIGE